MSHGIRFSVGKHGHRGPLCGTVQCVRRLYPTVVLSSCSLFRGSIPPAEAFSYDVPTYATVHAHVPLNGVELLVSSGHKAYVSTPRSFDRSSWPRPPPSPRAFAAKVSPYEDISSALIPSRESSTQTKMGKHVIDSRYCLKFSEVYFNSFASRIKWASQFSKKCSNRPKLK